MQAKKMKFSRRHRRPITDTCGSDERIANRQRCGAVVDMSTGINRRAKGPGTVASWHVGLASEGPR